MEKTLKGGEISGDIYTYPVFNKDSGEYVGRFTRNEIKKIGFKDDYFVIQFN